MVFFFQMAMMFIFIYKLSGEIGQKFNFLLSLIFFLFLKTPLLLVFWESAWAALSCIPNFHSLSQGSGQSFIQEALRFTILVWKPSYSRTQGANAFLHFMPCISGFAAFYVLNNPLLDQALLHQQLGKSHPGN